MKINLSIGDFSPLLRTPEHLFQRIQHTGIDGLELWVGLKSRWTPKHYLKLSEKYSLPIVSIHQPLWALTGLYFDTGFFDLARQMNVRSITCHPLPYTSLHATRMQRYFERLATRQSQTGIQILIENMPLKYRNGLLQKLSPLEPSTNSMLDVYRAAAAHGLGVTLDTDHLRLARPHQESWFEEIFPAIKNIHLSSFTATDRHQPVDIGILRTKELCQWIKGKKYTGLVTLEVNAPTAMTLVKFDHDAIARSVQHVRSAI